MKTFIVHFAFEGDEGYEVQKSKPIPASSEEEAARVLKDQFETYEGIPCDIIAVKIVNN